MSNTFVCCRRLMEYFARGWLRMSIFFGVLIALSGYASSYQYQADDNITIRKMNQKKQLEYVAELPEGSIVQLDKADRVGRRYYVNESKRSVRSRQGWYKRIQILSIKGKTYTPEQIKQFNQFDLYLSRAHLRDLVRNDKSDKKNTEGIDEQEETFGDLPKPIGIFKEVSLLEPIAIWERAIKDGIVYLKKNIVIPEGSIIRVRLKNEVGTWPHKNSKDDIVETKDLWLQGVVIVTFNGPLRIKKIRAINKIALFVKKSIQNAIDIGGTRAGPSNRYPKHIVIDTKDTTNCLPLKLWKIIKKTAVHFRQKVHIVSAYRSPRDNKRRGGARKSQHLKCKATDITIPGIKGRKISRYLSRVAGRGGLGFYCGDRIHIDVGPRRTWGNCR